jgi:ubiquinone/menaquinone biosynthesis C-methylase UbiE
MCADYVLDSANECERLERQAVLDGLERHLRHLPRLPRARVLDAGCGSGAMARLIASSHPEWDVVGLDVNPNYVSYARDRAKAASLENSAFEHGDLQALRFEKASFDVVWSRFVLYFLPQPEIAIAEFRRILRPGGEIVVALHNWSTLIDYPDDTDLRHRRTRVFSSIADMHLAPKMPSMLSAGGFRNVSVEIEFDRVYSAIGSIGAEARRNYVEVLHAGMERAVESLGSRSEAERFVADLLAYLDRPDTYTYSLLWTIKCQAPDV